MAAAASDDRRRKKKCVVGGIIAAEMIKAHRWLSKSFSIHDTKPLTIYPLPPLSSKYSLPLYMYVRVSLMPSFSLLNSLYVAPSLSVFVFIFVSLCMCLCVSVSLSLYLSVCLSEYAERLKTKGHSNSPT